MTDQEVETESFKIGDVVRLKSGSHSMSVGAVEKGVVTCDWALKGDIKTKTFHAPQLEMATPAQTLDGLFSED